MVTQSMGGNRSERGAMEQVMEGYQLYLHRHELWDASSSSSQPAARAGREVADLCASLQQPCCVHLLYDAL
jgi:hypothetical protein